MVYRNTIISLATLLAFGTACSKAPSYNTGVQTAATEQAVSDNATGSHGPMPHDDVTPKAPETKPDVVATKPSETPSTPPPSSAIVADPMKKLSNKAMFNMVNVTSAQGWGTTASNRLKVQVAVDAAGAIIPNQAGLATQYVAKIDPTDPNKIALADRQGNAVAVNSISSFMVVCNQSGQNIYLHSGTGGAPFSHGNAAVATGTCAAYPAQNLRATDGATYDHIAGDQPQNQIFIQLEKIGPDGKVVP